MHRLRLRAASSWCTTAWCDAVMHLGQLAEHVTARLRRSSRRPLTHDERTSAFQTAGYVCIAICWASFVWTILVYGRLVYNMLGGEEATSFTRSWGISVGISQAQDARDVLISIVQTVAMLLILETLWLLPNMAWMESTLDEASVHATVLRHGAGSAWSAARAYVRFHKAVV